MKSWINIPENSDFSIYNIPFGVARIAEKKIIVSRIGDTIINLLALQQRGYFERIELQEQVFSSDVLNDFIKHRVSFRIVGSIG